jgi:hypothetical protein
MKKYFSLVACFIVCAAMLQYRIANSDLQGKPRLNVTVWDAFGYYVYLPSIFIYNDYKHLDWLTEIDKKYSVTGGDGWQAVKLESGTYTFKYLGGVALMELPWFAVGHIVAKFSKYPQDGFSPPYQYALGFGVIIYCLIAFLILRKVLLRYYGDGVVGITILLVGLATNLIQYAAVDNGQSHAYIFLLYALVLVSTIKWHESPKRGWAALTGYVIGLATMSRPTEAVMLFIPLLWHLQDKEAASRKWQMVRQNKSHVAIAAAFGFLGILPQLIYWKLTTGSFIFDVGSKWDFLNPHFRVLFGWEKGWFIYTPVTLLFIAGMFFIKKLPFQKSVLWFCGLNIYIIIAWHDWRYGGSYSTRALVQSYPVFALPLAAFIERVQTWRWRPVVYIVFAYLVGVNLFQLVQYNTTVLHFNDMNRKYYGRIYLNPNPSPLDMSMLDNEELLGSEAGFNKQTIAAIDTVTHVHFKAWSAAVLFEGKQARAGNEEWIKIESDILAPGCLWQSFLDAEVVGDTVKLSRVRLFSPISKNDSVNRYEFYMQVPEQFKGYTIKVYLTSQLDFNGVVKNLKVTRLSKRQGN